MTYLDLAPAITALRARPEEFEFTNDTLHHPRSRHRFRFDSQGDVVVIIHTGSEDLAAEAAEALPTSADQP